MAAAAASSSSSNRICDVFLSFRGTDTRRAFVSFLYKELDRKNIDTFKDDEKLERGEYISSALLQAIEGSRFAVVVVSENYASSKWCLEELAKIMECNQKGMLIAVPVFYNVEPSDVRRRGGKFGEHLKKHEGREDPEDVRRWKDALTQLANLSGYNLTDCKDDSELVEGIVEDISNGLIKTTPSDINGLFGMNVHMEAMHKLLDLESRDEVRVVGIWGMGGIGKTTLAKYVYEKIRPHFQFNCFLEKVKERSTSLLQEKLLLENRGALEKGRFFVAPNVINSRLGRRRVLLVVDDVDNMEQLNALVGDTHWFGLGSRVIITTRDQRLLEGHGVEHVYKVPCLRYDDAFRLFCRFAFLQKHRLTNFQWLSECAVRLAGGLPLALEAFGSYLRNRSEADWKTALDILRRSPTEEVKEILKISYNGIGEQEKSLFLVISCLGRYLKGTGRASNMRVLIYHGLVDQRADWGMKQLAQKSLINILDSGLIGMHDLVLQMGREVGRLRYLTGRDEIRDVLANSQGTEAIEGIFLDMFLSKEGDEIMIDRNAFKKMPNLKYFIVEPFSVGGMEVSLPRGVNFDAPKLQLLRWDCYPHKTLQFTANNLVNLSLRYSKLKKLWDHRHPPCLPQLKEIDLSFSARLKEFPNLSKAPNVEVISASYCKSLTEVPSSISCLNKLTLLCLDYCEQLKRLPNNMNAKSLEIMGLDGCKSLEVFPRFFGGIDQLNLSGGRRRRISRSIGYLSHLEILNLSDFVRLKSLSDKIGDLTSLRELRIMNCPMLRRIPKTIRKLKSLERFWVSKCPNINECPYIPENVEEIGLIRTGIRELPAWIGDLCYLKYLYIDPNGSSAKGQRNNRSFSLDILAQIPYFAKLKVLKISLPEKSNDMSYRCPPLSNFPLLKRLHLINLNIVEIPNGLGELTHLEELNLTGNDFEKIPVGIKQLTKLDSLILKNCKRLCSLPEFPSDRIQVCTHGCIALETSLVLREPSSCAILCEEEAGESSDEDDEDSESTDHALRTHVIEKLLWICGVCGRSY